ncbi:MAG: site-2 protease family protein [Persicimonas sp.]
MFRESIRLGKLFGIQIKLNWSVLIIFGLIVFHLALGVFPEWQPDWSAWMLWTVSLTAAVVFFLSLLAHELAHSLTARAYGLPVRSITLFLFGGVSDIAEEPDTPGRELVIAGAGPLMSLVLGALFLIWFNLLVPVEAGQLEDPTRLFTQLGPLASVLAWVGPINILLAVFNMLPALPLDGGRIFRAILWQATGDLKKATLWSSTVARVFSWTLIAVGVAMALGIPIPFLGAGMVGGLWLALIGWFLGRAATASYSQLLLQEALEGMTVSKLMREESEFVPSDISIDQLVDEYLLDTDRDTFPVVDRGRYIGIVRFQDVHRVDQNAWPKTPVDKIAVTDEEIPAFAPDEELFDALRDMLRSGLDQAPVVDEDDCLIGVIVREDVFEWLQRHEAVPGF